MYDAIVVGAGPGGASAAYFLGKAGMRVLVLEKEMLPRYKPCGGGLSLRMLAKYFPFSFEPVIEERMDRIAYALGNKSLSIPLPDHSMAMVMRDRFDQFILSHAQVEVEQGAPVQGVIEYPDCVVVETKGGKQYKSRFVIGSDGASSIVAKSVGLRRRRILAAAIEAEAPVADHVLRQFHAMPLFIFGEMRTGYLWIFPKADHLSVGIAALHPKPGQLQTTLHRVMSQYEINLKGIPLHGHPLPIYTGRERIATARVLLIGDAAGLVDPLSGEGIRLAIKSGHLAVTSILTNQVERYSRWVYKQIGSSQTLGLALGQLFYSFPRACFNLGVRNPLATRAVVDLLSDQIGYGQVILRLFGTLPYSLLMRGFQARFNRSNGRRYEHNTRT